MKNQELSLKQGLSFLALCLVSPLSLANEFQVHTLRPNLSISELLYNELGISPIYGKRGKLEQILKLNDLTQDQAKKLLPGHQLKIPTEFITKTPPPTIEEKIIVPEAPAAPTSHSFLMSVEAGAFSYTGKSSSKGSFNASGPTTAFGLKHFLKKGSVILRNEGLLQASVVTGKRSEYPLNAGIKTSLNKEMNSYLVGGGFSFQRNFFVTSETGVEEKIVSGLVPGYFASIGRNFGNTSTRLDLGQNFSSTIDGDRKLLPAPALGISFFKNSDSWNLSGSFLWEKRRFDAFKQDYRQLMLGLSRTF